MSETTPDAAASAAGATRPKSAPTWLIVAIAVFFGLFYAYAMWNALGFLVEQASGPLGLNAYGWFVLTVAVAFPVVAFGIAFVVGWRRRAWQFTLVLLAGLCLVAVFWLDVVAYAAVYGASLLG
jgi:hypothetical protein